MEFSQITRDPACVLAETESTFREMYAKADGGLIRKAFESAKGCYLGKFQGYQAIDARYHDYEHTLQGTLCLVRMLRGRHLAKAAPPMPSRYFELALTAILLHDTGYLKSEGDHEGTGAKHTLIHVRRSAEFARWFMKSKGMGDQSIRAVQNMILCTGVNARLEDIPFQCELERECGFCLATADLLGQMAAEDYADKLPALYAEFQEAKKHASSEDTPLHRFQSARDLMAKTPGFWEFYVKPRIEYDFMAVYRYLDALPSSGGMNYMEAIERNIEALKARLEEEGLI